jgi:hypothetical protein
MLMKLPGQCDLKIVYDEKTELDPIVESVTWSGDVKQAHRQLEIQLVNTTNGRTRLVNIEKGRSITLSNFGKELFRGVVFSDEIDSTGRHSVTVLDEAVYLVKNSDSRKFVKLKASDIIRKLCTDFGVPVGKIADTGFVIPKLILPNKTLYDMMITALTVTKKQTGKRFFITMEKGRLNLYARTDRISEMYLESGRTLISASYSQSIEELRTQVKVIGGDESKPVQAIVKNPSLISKFGVMQHLEDSSEVKTKSQAEQKARNLLRELSVIDDEASVEAIGSVSVIAGSSLYVFEPMTRLTGGYYVTADSHTFQNGTHTMSLSISATDELPTIEYTEEA